MDFRSTFLSRYPKCPNKRMGIALAERQWFMLTDEQRTLALKAIAAYARFVESGGVELKYVPKPETWLYDHGPEFDLDETWLPKIEVETRNEIVCGDLVTVQYFWRTRDGKRVSRHRTRGEAEGKL